MNNFAWTITSKEDELLAYQEKPTTDNKNPQPVIIDAEAAKQRTLDLIVEAMENTKLGFVECLQRIGHCVYPYRSMNGAVDPTAVPKPEANKSGLILPGDKGFQI